jgi:hypothetical protein
VEALEPVNGWSFKFITLTKQYDPTDPEGLTVDGLRRRASEMAEACRALWRKLKAFGEKGEGACQFKVEIAGTGNVHAHMLVYSPYLDMGWVQSVTGCGHVWINVVAEGAEKGGIAEVTKYVTKVPSAMSETWLEGTWRKVLHPTLAARWEIATHKMQTRGLMGAFRGVKVAEETDAEAATEAEEIEKTLPEADEETACECCGTVGEFTTATRKTQEWVRECHSHGKKALWGSRWEPPEKAPR